MVPEKSTGARQRQKILFNFALFFRKFFAPPRVDDARIMRAKPAAGTNSYRV
jgi:hypothetical protein